MISTCLKNIEKYSSNWIISPGRSKNKKVSNHQPATTTSMWWILVFNTKFQEMHEFHSPNQTRTPGGFPGTRIFTILPIYVLPKIGRTKTSRDRQKLAFAHGEASHRDSPGLQNESYQTGGAWQAFWTKLTEMQRKSSRRSVADYVLLLFFGGPAPKKNPKNWRETGWSHLEFSSDSGCPFFSMLGCKSICNPSRNWEFRNLDSLKIFCFHKTWLLKHEIPINSLE